MEPTLPAHRKDEEEEILEEDEASIWSGPSWWSWGPNLESSKNWSRFVQDPSNQFGQDLYGDYYPPGLEPRETTKGATISFLTSGGMGNYTSSFHPSPYLIPSLLV